MPTAEDRFEPTDSLVVRRDDGSLVAMAPDQQVIDTRAAWKRLLPSDSPEMAPERRISRDELIARLRDEGLSVTAFDLGNWQAAGVVPFGISRWDGRVTRTFYPPIMVDIVRSVRALQANGRKLAEIGPLLQEHFAGILGRDADNIDPPEFPHVLADFARNHERIFGHQIVRAEVRLIDDRGIPSAYRFDLPPAPD